MESLKKLVEKSVPIKESEVLANLSSDTINDWDNFMRGKTCPILENGDHGVYPWDLSQFINLLEK